MHCRCIRHTDLPHTSRLFADLIYHFDRVRGFYQHAPQAADSFSAAAGQVRLDPAHRARLVAALAEENRDGSEAARLNLDRLAQPETLVVATGQQVGLYTGPVYTIYKALTAARLATELTARGIPSVPVFWLATEDHDLAEVKHAWVFDAAQRPVRLEAAASPERNQPVGGVRLDDNAASSLQAALAGLPFGEEVGRLAAEDYAGGATFASGFKRLLARLLAPYGVLLLDPQSAELRRLAAPVLAQAIEKAPELTAALLARGKELEAAGYHTQVHMEEKTSLFFLLENGRRTALRRSGDSYTGNGAVHTRAELRKRLELRPEDFSPNALLRPVVQDYLLPTVAYIGGPAELAYLAQAEVLYARELGRMPVALPRACFTILDARGEKLLGRYGLEFTDALHDATALEQRIAETLIPPPLEQTFRGSHGQIEEALQAVDAQLLAFDPTLAAAMAKSRRKIEYQFSKIRAKAARESLRRTERARADAAYLSGLIFPEKVLQERLYSVLPFLARHGMDLMGQLHHAIRFDCPDHQVLVA
ncbi:MAG TPA: bacillithiol biosynthesis cysteine-adding enzyme BshC [Bryobacterales bacterium]|nr:bacillithiol biosynthesis cysteine-adding enzyme BshC [Bryobacterales bacterium]